MTRIIPRDLIRHLEWTPEKTTAPPTPAPATTNPTHQIETSIDALLNKPQEFYSEEKDGDKCIGLAVALQEAENTMGTDGVIASLPYLIAGKSQADKDHYLWTGWFDALTEEDAGLDTEGRLAAKNEPIVVVVHGGGILNSARIRQAYAEGLTTQNAAKFSPEEFNDLLKGNLPSGEKIELYSINDIKKGISHPLGKYAVWMPAHVTKSKPSTYHTKDVFMNNELVIARAGTLEYLESYFEKAKNPIENTVGNWHRFNEIDFNQPRGCMILVNDNFNGLVGSSDLYHYGRFIGVRAEDARLAKKEDAFLK